jgi:hypothetical protein
LRLEDFFRKILTYIQNTIILACWTNGIDL